MNKPNPWILFMGGIALLNVSMLVAGLHAAPWVRYGGMAACVVLGVTCMGLGLREQFKKKPERTKFVPKRRREPPAPG
jgi:hypothetical protein